MSSNESVLREALAMAVSMIRSGEPLHDTPGMCEGCDKIRAALAAAPPGEPFGPEAAASSGGTSPNPLSQIAAMAVDLGPADLSSTFRRRRGAPEDVQGPDGLRASERARLRLLERQQKMRKTRHVFAPDRRMYCTVCDGEQGDDVHVAGLHGAEGWKET